MWRFDGKFASAKNPFHSSNIRILIRQKFGIQVTFLRNPSPKICVLHFLRLIFAIISRFLVHCEIKQNIFCVECDFDDVASADAVAVTTWAKFRTSIQSIKVGKANCLSHRDACSLVISCKWHQIRGNNETEKVWFMNSQCILNATSSDSLECFLCHLICLIHPWRVNFIAVH